MKSKLNFSWIYWLTFSVVIFVTSCKNNGFPKLILKEGFKGKIDLKNVQLAGPFLYDSSKTNEINSIEENNLECFGLREDSLSEKDFLKISYESATNKKFLHQNFKNISFNVTSDNIDFLDLIGKTGIVGKESNFYLACNIKSDNEQKIILLASTCFGIKIWLNNRLIQKETGKISFPKGFDYFMTLPLKKGKNFLMIKTNRGINHICWRLICKFSDIQTAKEEYGINCFTDFIVNPIVQNQDTLNTYVGGYMAGKTIKVYISDKINNHKIYDSINVTADAVGYCQIPVNSLKDDFYKCSFISPPDTFKEMFYHGDILKLNDSFKAEIEALKILNKQDKASLDGAMERLDYLLHKEYLIKSRSEIKFNDKNVMITAFSIRNILENAKKDESKLYKNARETYLRAYLSKIDGQYQYYMFHVSDKVLAQKNIPLVIVLPFSHNPLSPMLKSWYLSNIDQIEWEKQLADNTGFALLWPYLRGNSSSSPISTTDFFEAFEDVKQNYNIDPDRVFLMGDCAGATRVLMLASRYPDMFAGLSLFQAVTKSQFDAYNIPINFVGNLFNIPIYVYHSTKDDVISVSNSDDFVNLAESYGFKPLYNRNEKESHYNLPKNCHYPIFQFFKNKHRNQCPDTIYYTTYEQKYNKAYWIRLDQFIQQGKAEVTAIYDNNKNSIQVKTVNISEYTIFPKNLKSDKSKPILIYTNGKVSYKGLICDSICINLGQKKPLNNQKNKYIEGPINHFFADKFAYIQPDNDTSISGMISRDWGQQAFFNLNTIKENKYNESFNDCNIILFDNQYKNPKICDLISRLPIKYDKSNLIFRNEEIKEKNLSFCFIYPNPFNTKKYVLYMGANRAEDFRLYGKNFVIIGNYDYVIWNKKGYEIKKGFFDLNWQ
ncbi:MAG: hypothetical protein HOO91_08145 [Bacteroidales bacterium]|nr:hypothetical protein [Bacteroidales bacterium]